MKKSRWNKKLKRWHDRHCYPFKSSKIKRCGSEKKYTVPQSEAKRYVNPQSDNHRIEIIAPKKFSLTENTEETMAFFMKFVQEIERKQYRTHFYIDSSLVEYVTVDALIYLIAILQNDRINIQMKYRYSGNFPLNENAKKIYENSGFTDYVDSKTRNLPADTEKMRIVSGLKNDADTAKKFCEFVMEKLGKKRIEVRPLQKIFIELMSNVYHHAYGNNEIMAKKWYIYAEHIEDHVRFVFVDTGMGIAKTVRKNFKEKIANIFGIKTKDATLLQSAFEGEFRTQTKEEHRGNGLSTVKEQALSGLFKNFEVISGRGKCIISSECDVQENMIVYDYENTIYGTLYTFDVY